MYKPNHRYPGKPIDAKRFCTIEEIAKDLPYMWERIEKWPTTNNSLRVIKRGLTEK